MARRIVSNFFFFQIILQAHHMEFERTMWGLRNLKKKAKRYLPMLIKNRNIWWARLDFRFGMFFKQSVQL